MIVLFKTSYHDANLSLAFIETIDEDVRLILHVVTLTKLRVLRVLRVFTRITCIGVFQKEHPPPGYEKKNHRSLKTERRAMKVFLLSAFVVIATASAACGPDGCEGVRLSIHYVFEMHCRVV